MEYDHVIIKGDFDINMLNLKKRDNKPIITSQIIITNSQIRGKLNFKGVIIEKQAFFDHTYFGGYTCFIGAQFIRGATFRKAKFSDSAYFNEAKFDFQGIFDEAEFMVGAVFIKTKFNSDATFNRAWFIWDANFTESQFNSDAHFWGTQFSKSALFDQAKFNGDVYFWKGAHFNEYAQFCRAQFNGDVLTFRDAVFMNPLSQEGACRRAKNVLERNGDREEAGYHFYREMEAKRKQKGIDYEYSDYESLLFCSSDEKNFNNNLTSISRYIKYNLLEYLFIQIIFGYGVHPFRLWGCWFAFVFAFALIYFIGNGVTGATQIWDYIWFSITVAVTPGFAGYKPTTGLFQVVAGLEAILGTFMWAAFIATFARKYMR